VLVTKPLDAQPPNLIGSIRLEGEAQQRTPSTPVPLLAASLLIPPLGVLAFWHAREAVRTRADRPRMLHHIARSRSLVYYSLGGALTLFVLGFLVAVFTLNDFAVAKDYANPKNFAESMPGVIKAFGTNVILSVIAFAASVVWGLALAIVRGLPGPALAPVRFLATAYVDLFRGLPGLLTILIIAFGLPQTGLPIVSGMDIFASGILTLTILYGAYISEVFRAGIESVHTSQVAAARSIGLTYAQTMRFIVLPQAVLRIVPPLLSWYISILKDTSLLSVLGLLEGVNIARIMVTNQSNLTALTGISLCFLVVTVPLSRLADYLVRRANSARIGGS
jgi:polar amino acid transport system permease protein